MVEDEPAAPADMSLHPTLPFSEDCNTGGRSWVSLADDFGPFPVGIIMTAINHQTRDYSRLTDILVYAEHISCMIGMALMCVLGCCLILSVQCCESGES